MTSAARAFALLLAVAACNRAAPDAGDVVRTDSAGVRIVTSGAADRELPWRFERIDVLRDSAGDPWLFTRASARTVITDRAGRTYALDDRRIVRFGRDGRQELVIGRRGQGPGEMELPTAIGAQGDSIFALDPLRAALVRWGPTFAPIAQLPLTGALGNVDRIAFRTGGFWAHRREFAEGVYTLSLIADTAGGPPLHRVQQPRATMVRMCNGGISWPPFFSPRINWAATGPRVLVNAEPGYVLWLHEGARIVASVRRPLTPRAPRAEDAEREMPNGLRVQFGNATAPCTLSAADAFAQAGSAPLLPLVQDLQLLSDGTMWVLRSFAEESPIIDVFGSDGAYVGTVTGLRLPIALLPNGELLVPAEDEESGGTVLARMRVAR